MLIKLKNNIYKKKILKRRRNSCQFQVKLKNIKLINKYYNYNSILFYKIGNYKII